MLKHINKIPTGFTMLEMLIALLVLSIGLLGVAALQTRGQQFNQAGYLRTQSTFLAYDFMDRIRINSDSTVTTNNGENGAYATTCSTQPSPPANPNCDTITNCTIDNLVNYDLIQWCGVLEDTLPGGDAVITWDVTIEEYTIVISWDNILNRNEGVAQETSTWELQL